MGKKPTIIISFSITGVPLADIQFCAGQGYVLNRIADLFNTAKTTANSEFSGLRRITPGEFIALTDAEVLREYVTAADDMLQVAQPKIAEANIKSLPYVQKVVGITEGLQLEHCHVVLDRTSFDENPSLGIEFNLPPPHTLDPGLANTKINQTEVFVSKGFFHLPIENPGSANIFIQVTNSSSNLLSLACTTIEKTTQL